MAADQPRPPWVIVTALLGRAIRTLDSVQVIEHRRELAASIAPASRMPVAFLVRPMFLAPPGIELVSSHD